MMWRLLHALFGWDYVQWDNSVDQGIARVHRSGGGDIYYWRYKSIKCADIIYSRDQVLWLTCHPSKYL